MYVVRAKKLTILFDVDALSSSTKSGVGYYTLGLISALASHDPEHIQLVGHYFDFLGRTKPLLPSAPNISYRVSRLIPRKLVNMFRRLGVNVPFELLIKTRGDFILYPNFIGYPSLFKTPYAVVFHDATYLDNPEYVSPRNQKDLEQLVPKTLRKATLVVTISEASKQRILAAYPWLQAPILVKLIPPITRLTQTPLASIPKAAADPFILYVGTLEPRKNVEALVEAYSKLPDPLRKNYRLVLAGNKGWQVETTMERIAELQKQGERIEVTGYVSDEQLANLYHSATLFVLPSHSEGFGMPILEAMQNGLPAMVSDIPVFHEVAGVAAAYFDPQDTAAMTLLLAELLATPAKREQLRKAGLKNLERFHWEDMARDILAAIQSHL